jgi:hypothetical protein
MDRGAVECSPSDLELLRRHATFFGGAQGSWNTALAALAVAMRRADVTMPPPGATLSTEARAKLMHALESIAAGPASEDIGQPAAR